MAVMTGADPTPELEALRRVPLEKRYVWRVASALKWAFVDCEDMNVEADRRTMTAEDFTKLRELLKLRPMQFAIFLRALFGPEEMERLMLQGIAAGKQV